MVEDYMYESSKLMEKKFVKRQRNNIVNLITRYTMFIWLLLICLLPIQLNILKMGLLGILCMCSFFNIVKSKKKINGKFLLYTLLFSLIYFIFLLYGTKNGYEFDYKLIEIFCLRPIVLFFLVNLINNKHKFIFLMKSIIIITFIVIIYNFIYILGALNIIPKIFSWENGGAIISENFLAIRVSNQGVLMYLMPMSIMLIADIKNINFTFFFRIIIKINIILGTIVVMLSGRRILQICTLISIICLFIYLFKKNKKNRRNIKAIIIYSFIALIVILVGLIVVEKISKILGIGNLFSVVYETIFDAINSGEYTGNVRQLQFDALIYEWMKKPIMGWGLNAYVPYFIRSSITKWSYEYVYIAFLFQTGIMGVLILVIYFLKILKKIYKKYVSNKNNEFGIFFISNYVGFICFLIAGYTNPLVASLWAWIIALVCANIDVENSVCKY